MFNLWQVLAFLVGPGILLVLWKRLVSVRVTTHDGFHFHPPASWMLEEVFARGGDPERIIVTKAPEPLQQVTASASALVDVPAGVPRTRAIFIRVMNNSPERAITVNGIWLDAPGKRIPVIVPKGQITIATKRRWEAWVSRDKVRAAFPNVGDVYTSVRVRVAEKRRLVSSVRADDEEVGPAGELATSA